MEEEPLKFGPELTAADAVNLFHVIIVMVLFIVLGMQIRAGKPIASSYGTALVGLGVGVGVYHSHRFYDRHWGPVEDTA